MTKSNRAILESVRHLAGVFAPRLMEVDAGRIAGIDTQYQLTLCESHRAAILQTQLTNPATMVSDPMSALCFSAKLADQGEPYRGCSAAGGAQMGQYPPSGCFRMQRIRIDESLWIGTMSGGRSSDVHMPFTLLADKNGAGMWFALEWSGLWYHFSQSQQDGTLGITATIGLGTGYSYYVLDSEFRMQPGESITLPRVHLGFFEGGFDEGCNAVRRYLRQEICPKLDGKSAIPHLTYDHWFGIGMNFDHLTLCKQVDRAAELGLEFFVLDAGWFEGGFPHGVGSWEPDKKKFPDGLQPFTDYVRARGMKFGIFYEPERANRDSRWAQRYPDLFIDGGYPSLVLNFAKREAQDLVIEHTDKLIREHDIRWIRWDLNLDIAPYWRAADPTGRIQLGYNEGLYRVLGELRRRHPQYVHENCASGGRRIDIGTLRYAQSAWINDTTVSADLCRFIQLQANVLLPAHLCGSGVPVQEGHGDKGLTDYDVLSRMAGSLLFSGDIASWSASLTKQMRQAVDVFRDVRHLLVEDYYRLLPTPVEVDDWDAAQFVKQDRSEALLFIFRPAGGDATKKIHFKALTNAMYRVYNRLGTPGNSQPEQKVSGQKLMEQGLKISLPSRGAALLQLKMGI